jgi:hypothetical protein
MCVLKGSDVNTPGPEVEPGFCGVRTLDSDGKVKLEAVVSAVGVALSAAGRVEGPREPFRPANALVVPR